MFISTTTYGGIDWHDSRTIHEQVEYKGSYEIAEEDVPEAIAEDVAKDFPYIKDLKEKVLQALSDGSSFRFTVKNETTDADGNRSYEDGETYTDGTETRHENEATFDGKEKTLQLEYAFGQVTYTTGYYVENIPEDHIGYIVTEDFLAPSKGIDLVERLYHDIFDDLGEAKEYAKNLKLHGFQYPSSIVTFLVCDKYKVMDTEWYALQKQAMTLMAENGQTYLDDSFSIFAQNHIDKLQVLNGTVPV